MNKNAVRIVAIVLAALMFIGVFAGAIINSFALECAQAAVIPSMGERSKLVPILIAVAAILIGGGCLAGPKIKSKFSKADAVEDQSGEK